MGGVCVGGGGWWVREWTAVCCGWWVVGDGEVVGEVRLADHFNSIAKAGGKLKEVDEMTTTTGVLKLFTKGEI